MRAPARGKDPIGYHSYNRVTKLTFAAAPANVSLLTIVVNYNDRQADGCIGTCWEDKSFGLTDSLHAVPAREGARTLGQLLPCPCLAPASSMR